MEDAPAGRSKRQKIDRHGRMSAFEKLKQLKSTGSKRKYEVDTLENVYDTVDESEYTERVLQRREDDWIDDDDGCGYVEDGREIFDDEEAVEPYNPSKKKDEGNNAKKRKARVSALADPSTSGTKAKGNIRNLISNMPNKKKEVSTLSEDSILSDIMSEISKDPSLRNTQKSVTNNAARPSQFLDTSKRDAQDYFKSLNVPKVTKPANQIPYTNGKSHRKIPKVDDYSIVHVPSPKKVKFDDDVAIVASAIKEEVVTLNGTQNIEEVHTEDHYIDNIDFDEDSLQEKSTQISKTVDGLNVDDFLDSNFDTPLVDQDIKPDPKLLEAMSADVMDKKEALDNWSAVEQTPQSVSSYDTNTLPLHTLEDGSKVLRFYWWDAWEDRFIKPGVVFLFGKVYVDHSNPSLGCISCCVCVKNIDRKMYLLPRENKLDAITLEEDSDNPVSFTDIYEEFNNRVASKLDIKAFKSRKVTKNYAFDLPNVPVQSEYMEVRYAATYPAPPLDKKYLTFSNIFGSNTSSLETFLLERKIKGPCWLNIQNPEYVSNKVSWCKVEANCLKPEDISVLRSENIQPPPLTIATIHCRTVVDPKTRHNMIVMLTCLISNSFEIHKPPTNPPFQQHFCVFTRSSNEIWPADLKQMLNFKGTKLTKCESERELLSYFLVQFWKLDPDLVVGHDLLGYQQDLLIGNTLDKNISNWSRLGRLRRTTVPQRKFAAKDAFLGRLVCDIKLSSMELIRSRSYDLDTLCCNVLKLPEGNRTEIMPEELYKYYETSADLYNLISLTMQDTTYILKIMCELNVLPLALQITQIAGNVMSRTLMGGRSERNEFLLLHAFTEKDYIVPDKVTGKRMMPGITENDNTAADGTKLSKKQVQSRKKPAYSGGLVLDPKKGFYDSLILLMDFNSLYPSIIQEYNICFTTIKRNVSCSNDDEINEMILPDSNVDLGILPTQIRMLVESRRKVKGLMKATDLRPEQYMQYNIRQLALKLTANSMYGCLGFTYSRFYAKALAALVTLKGREILTNTKELVGRLNYDVIYGDTDSIMINTNCLDYDQVFKIGYDIKKEINKKYRHIELEIDGVFKYLLLLKKKKYAAVLISKNKNGEFVTNQELKGLDIVRRDWSQLAAESGKFILNQILSEQASDERLENVQAHLTKLREDLKDGKMPLSVLAITKQLTKNPDEYPDKKGQPHVQVALRLNSKNGRKYKKGDIVPYIICEDGTSNVPMQRAYHIEELKNSEHLKVDVNYYLAHQLHPVISRICDPIDGMDSARIADFLGLDSSSYKQSVRREASGSDEIFELENEKNKYRECLPFSFTCVNDQCNSVNSVKEINVSFLDRCQNEKCTVRPLDYLPAILNQLTVQIREYYAKYYENWIICEDTTCTNRTVRVPHKFFGGYPLCNLCEKGLMYREYSERDLYYQISYFRYLFDVNSLKGQKFQLNPQVASGLHCLKECVEDALSHSAYSVINLCQLFGFCDAKAKSSVEVKTEPSSFDDNPDMELNEYDTHLEMYNN